MRTETQSVAYFAQRILKLDTIVRMTFIQEVMFLTINMVLMNRTNSPFSVCITALSRFVYILNLNMI